MWIGTNGHAYEHQKNGSNEEEKKRKGKQGFAGH